MKTYLNLYDKLTSFRTLYKAYHKVRRHKKDNKSIREFEYRLEENILNLQQELKCFTYRSSRMDPILIPHTPPQKAIFSPCLKDRVVQQAIRMTVYPLFNKTFIHDSYAFRIGKGTHAAIRRFDSFKQKAARRNKPASAHILKMDIKKYYLNINHRILLTILGRKIKDKRLIWLIKDFLRKSPNKTFEAFGPKGIPIGSPLSQTLANIYLNELDYFIKHGLGCKYYIRFADDFVVLGRKDLTQTKYAISTYLWQSLLLSLHPQKTRLTTLDKGVNFLGYKIFYFHKRVKSRNLKNFTERLRMLKKEYSQGLITQEKLTQKIRGWVEYARYADSYNLRKRIFEGCVFVKEVRNSS